MYAGAIAVPLIVGRALKLAPEDVAFLISADLFACGIVSMLQSLGFTRLVRHPAAGDDGRDLRLGRPDGGDGARNPGVGAARHLRRDHRAPASSAMLLAPLVSRLLRFFPPVVTGTIILVIGISLMRVGINWTCGGRSADRAQASIRHRRLESATALADPAYGALGAASPMRRSHRASLVILAASIASSRKGFLANVAVLLGIVAGCVIAAALGHDALRQGRRGAAGSTSIYPFHFGTADLRPGR